MPANVLVYLEFSIGDKAAGRVVFELYRNAAPRATENFRALCVGDAGESLRLRRKLTYEGSEIFSVRRGQFLCGGDIENNDGTGGESVFGGLFEDENFSRRHVQPGILSTLRRKGHEAEPNGNGSQFLVTLGRCPQLDSQSHVAFGQVVEGMEVLRAIELIPLDATDAPRVPITVTACGELGRRVRPRKDDPRALQRAQVSELMASLDVPELERTTRSEIRVAPLEHKAKSSAQAVSSEPLTAGGVIIRAPAGLYKADESKEGVERAEDEEEDAADEEEEKEEKEENDLVSAFPAGNPYIGEIVELQAEMKRAREENAEAVEEDLRRPRDPKEDRELQLQRYKEVLRETDERLLGRPIDEDEEENPAKYGKAAREAWEQQGGFLNETAESVQRRIDNKVERKRKAAESYGWGNFSLEAQYAAHEKRTKDLVLNEAAYEKQMAQLDEAFYDPTRDLVSASFQPTEAAKEKMAAQVREHKKKRHEFSRRRAQYVDFETVHHINEQNRSFNQKLEKAYGTQYDMS